MDFALVLVRKRILSLYADSLIWLVQIHKTKYSSNEKQKADKFWMRKSKILAEFSEKKHHFSMTQKAVVQNFSLCLN